MRIFCGRLSVAALAFCAVAAEPEDDALLVVAHGSRDTNWNQRVVRMVERIDWSGPKGVAFLTGQPPEHALTNVAARLDRPGVREIVVVPLLVSSFSGHYEEIRFYTGQRQDAPGHAHHGSLRTKAALRLTAAMDGHPLISRILADQVQHSVKDAPNESLVLVAHGPNEDHENERWLEHLHAHAERIQQQFGFHRVQAFTLRDDAPKPIRDAATERLQTSVREAATHSRVLVLPVLVSVGRLQQEIRERLSGLDYTMVEGGLANHALAAEWVRTQAGQWLSPAPQSVPVRTEEGPARRRSESEQPGFVVVAPDRGFLGNIETEEAFEAFAKGRNAQLVFATDERTKSTLDRAIKSLVEAGAQRAVILPLFLSSSDSGFVLVRTFVGPRTAGVPSRWPIPVSIGQTFGESYLAVEVLADRFREIHNSGGRRVVVIGCGARDAKSRQRMEADWQRIADKAAEGFGFESVRALVWYDSSLPNYDELAVQARESLQAATKGAERAVIVPFHLGKKLDGMMSFTASLRRMLPPGSELLDGEVTPHPVVAMWLAREANRHVPLCSDEIGVVFLAHGSDYHWNETMRESVQALTDDYRIEFAFCMADPPLVERAVHRLEQRGARAIVIVRVFGLAASFKASVERMIGLDVEQEAAPPPHATHGHTHHQHTASQSHGDDHGHGPATGGPPPRIRSSALLTTVGGLEDHQHFAEALLDRARGLSAEPSRETVILVAHGSGDDRQNEQWRGLLKSLADQMRVNGGAKFRAIHVGTWREDWPDKREPEVTAVRRMVQEAGRDGGRAIVIPARTTSEGFEKKFLKGLDFKLGSGFAPHPLFVRWFEEQIRTGLSELGAANPDEVGGAKQARR